MHLTTWNPRVARRPVDKTYKLFDDFFTPFSGYHQESSNSSFYPSVDIYEEDDVLVIEAELPGISKENIKVDVNNRLLTLAGERTIDEKNTEAAKYRRERHYGTFERTFKLPFEVSEKHINATYKNGILTLRVEKPEEQKPKQITIN